MMEVDALNRKQQQLLKESDNNIKEPANFLSACDTRITSSSNNNNNKHPQLQDKRLQELRAFALEYVKQIVAKASELSQERQEARNAQKLAHFYTGSSLPLSQHNHQTASHPLLSFEGNAEFRDEASKINDRFQHQLYSSYNSVAADDREQLTASSSCSDNTRRQQQQHNRNSIGSKKRRHHKLNWHLLISCFSTCLPHNLADSIPSKAGHPSDPSSPL